MTLYFEQNDQENTTPMRRPYRAPLNALAGDDGIEGRFNNDPLSLAPVWQTTPQEWQPPAIRYFQKFAGLMRAEAVDINDVGPFLAPFKSGWDVQPFQPPVRIGTALMRSAAVALGDPGNQYIFIPPWAQAAGASTFPDYQNRAAGAIPAWQAGPPAGAVNTLPNITSPTLLKATPGNLLAVSIVVAGSTAGAIYDCSGYNLSSSANQMFVLGNTVGFTEYDWPFQNGILIVPGTGQTVAAKWV
jgi:hypothetical protein